MASSNKTSLGLTQYSLDDIPDMTDTNNDNVILTSELEKRPEADSAGKYPKAVQADTSGTADNANNVVDGGPLDVRLEAIEANVAQQAEELENFPTTGTAAMAKKLETAREIGLTGAVRGSAEFDGSGNLNINTANRSSVVGPSSTNVNKYYKIAETIETNTFRNVGATFLVVKPFGSDAKEAHGILRVEFRTNTPATKIESCSLIWEYAGVAINPNDFFLLYKPEDSHMKIEIWTYINFTNVLFHFVCLEEHDRYSQLYGRWTLFNTALVEGESSLPEGYTQVPSTYSDLKAGEIFTQAETPSAGNSLVWKDYADAVPYKYAQSAGFPGSETIYKRNLAYQPTFFYENTTLFNTPGIVKIASAIRTNIESNLILEGAIRNMSATNMFRIVINQRAAATSNNFVTFEGIGNLPPASFVNLIVTKNDSGLIEVYVEATSTSSSYAVIVFKVYVERVNHWTLRENPALEFTSGTIPGTKVWDLKTAWGTTSRTQITKEEADAQYLKNTGGTVNGALSIESNSEYSPMFSLKSAKSNIKMFTTFTESRQEKRFAIQTVDNEPIIWQGVANPTSNNDAANKKYVDDKFAALQAQLASALNLDVATLSVPNEAPTLEAPGEEEITV